MKRLFFLTLFFMFGVIMNTEAQTYKYYSTDFAYKTKNTNGYWSEWSEWEESRCLVTINLDRDVINIYSETIQEFDIYEMEGDSEDEDGISFTLRCIDKNGLRCSVRFRKQNNGILQLYIQYKDLMYVYCLKEKN